MSAYDNAHAAVVRARGVARGWRCIDCGGQALDWSLRREAAITHVDPVDGVYSLQVTDYDPRCRSCHTRYDGKVANLGVLSRPGELNPFYGHQHTEEAKAAKRGALNPQAKVTEADVIEMRRLVAEGALQKDVAARFGLQKMQVSRIIRGERWAHVA